MFLREEKTYMYVYVPFHVDVGDAFGRKHQAVLAVAARGVGTLEGRSHPSTISS